MSIASFLGLFGGSSYVPVDRELPKIFPMAMAKDIFVETDILSVYSRILTDTFEHTHGIDKDIWPLLWDNCLQNENNRGLVTMLATAMAKKADLFLVYQRDINFLRLATAEEAAQIREDYTRENKSSVGVFVSFKNYARTDMIKLYSSLSYCVVASLNKSLNVARSLQFKIDGMRSSIAVTDRDRAIEQAVAMATGLGDGRDAMMDKNDEIFSATPSIDPAKQAILFLDSKNSFYYGMPVSYINGELTGGIGSTGEADTNAIERGLRQYFISIVKPVLEAVFGIKVTFKSNNFRQLSSALETLKTFDLVGTQYISEDQKMEIVKKLFDLEPEVA